MGATSQRLVRRRTAAAAEVRAAGIQQNRVDYRHGGLIEWYVNDEAGLKQGFTIATPPDGLAAGNPLQIELEFGGDLPVERQAGGSGMIFRSPGTPGGLKMGISQAFDANGSLLKTWIELSDRTLTLSVDDSQAAYPLSIEVSINSIGETPYWENGPWDYALGRDFQVATAGDVNNDGYSDIMIGAPYFDSTYDR